jgi:hypothetical protein
MATTKQEQYERLRKLFNSAIRGPNIDAMLWALANPAVNLINNIEAIHDNVYIATAVDRYLDQRLADYNLVRPPEVGLSDDIFRQIGISVINKKQVRELLMSILSIVFGEELTQATAKSSTVEPYSLSNGDLLKVKFDGGEVVDIKFESSQFVNISSATAQEVADAITKSLREQGKTGRAFSKDDGSGAYVVLISDTEGPQSSVVVLGGRAQNKLLFDKIRPTTGGASTQWTVSLVSGGTVRFTWSGGANPSIGKVRVGDYVNIFASGFSAANKGTFTIQNIKGGTVNNAYFEIENPSGVPEIVAQGTVDGVLFFQPFKNTIITKSRYAALFQEESRLLEIFIPATTKVVRRDRKGAAHIHEPVITTETYDAGKNEITDVTVPVPTSITDGSYFLLNSANNTHLYYVYFDTTGGNLVDPAIPSRTGIRVDISTATTATDVAVKAATAINNIVHFNCSQPSGSTFRICNAAVGVCNDVTNGNVAGLSISVFQQGTNVVSTTTSNPNPDELLPDQEGPYTYDPSQSFVLSNIGTSSTAVISPDSGRVIQVSNSSSFPDNQGFLMIGYGTDKQEGPIPYLSRPSNNTLLLSPSYRIVNTHPSGTEVRLISQIGPVSIDKSGRDFPAYLTDVVSGRNYAENLIKEVSATGINVVITILYPGSEGLGKWSEVYDEKVVIWGGDSDV